jgi:hypothetical protein
MNAKIDRHDQAHTRDDQGLGEAQGPASSPEAQDREVVYLVLRFFLTVQARKDVEVSFQRWVNNYSKA